MSERHDQSLADKACVIIGGTTGIGLSAAQAFLVAGACGVVITGRNPESARSAIEKLGANCRALNGDACSPAHAPEAIDLCVQAFGRCDGFYHVAGGSGRKFGDGPLDELPDEAVRATLQMNLDSVIFSNRAAVKHFLKINSGGAILNMSSVLGWSPSPKFFGTPVYAAAKAGIIGFTKAIAAHYASKYIRANVLAPALVETPMSGRAVADSSIMNYIHTKQPLDGGRVGHPRDCDGAAVFLLSDAAKFITGQVLAVDGGWTVSEGQHA